MQQHVEEQLQRCGVIVLQFTFHTQVEQVREAGLTFKKSIYHIPMEVNKTRFVLFDQTRGNQKGDGCSAFFVSAAGNAYIGRKGCKQTQPCLHFSQLVWTWPEFISLPTILE